MFGGLKAVLQRLKEKLTVPAAAFGVLGVSTTLACCYGPPPDYPVEDYETIEACESMLRECAQVHGLWSDDCTTDAMASCSESINRRAGKVFSTSASANYESSVLGLQDNKEITEAATLEALVMPWMNCAVKGVSRAESCQGGAQYIDVAHILSGNRFKDRNVRRSTFLSPKYSPCSPPKRTIMHCSPVFRRSVRLSLGTIPASNLRQMHLRISMQRKPTSMRSTRLFNPHRTTPMQKSRMQRGHLPLRLVHWNCRFLVFAPLSRCARYAGAAAAISLRSIRSRPMMGIGDNRSCAAAVSAWRIGRRIQKKRHQTSRLMPLFLL